MIPSIQIVGGPDPHPEKAVHDVRELVSGKIDITTLEVVSHNVRVFDLMDTVQREEYEHLYVDLSRLAKKGKILISSNTREVMTKPDGSTGWFKFLEWTEFDTSGILGA